MENSKHTTSCGKSISISELIGKKVKIANDKHHEGQIWEVLRKGLFSGCVDIKQPNHVYCDVKISDLELADELLTQLSKSK